MAVVALISAVGTYSASAQTTVIDLSKNGADQIWQGGAGVANVGYWFDQGELGIGDSRKDLIIGAPGNGGTLGHVYIMFGGHVASGAVNISTASDATFTGAVAGDGFGFTTASGNVLTTEASGALRDLAISAPSAFGGKGVVYLFRGGLPLHSSYGTGDAVATIVGATGDNLGAALATGDMNGDGYRDVIIGAPGNNRVYVVAGGPAMAGTINLATAPTVATFTVAGIGAVLAAGDLNGDNRSEIFMGAPAANTVYVTFGQAAGPYPAPTVQFTGVDAGDRAGAALRILDLDADGNRDLVISAPDANGPGNARAASGEVYTIWGGAGFTGKSLSLADVTFYGGIAGSHTGSFLASGDINRDTPNDLALGLTSNASGGTELDIYYGRARNAMGSAVGSRRVVDLATAGQVNRWILSTPGVGEMTSAIVFEVTGEGARDIIVGIPSAGSGTGGAYFTISPKMLLNKNTLNLFVNEGSLTGGTVEVINRSEVWVSWGTTSASNWLTASPATGFAAQAFNGIVNVRANAAGLAPGPHTGTLNVASTGADLTMTLPVTVNLWVTGTRIALDNIANEATVTQPFTISGWAVDVSAATGTGVDRVDVYAYPGPGSGSTPLFLGTANYGGGRGDIGALYGARFTNSAWSIGVGGLTPGTRYQIVAFARSTVTHVFASSASINLTISASSPQPNPAPQPSPDPVPNPNPSPDPGPTTGGPLTFSVNRTALNFGLVRSGAAVAQKTPAQTLVISQHGSGTMAWTVTPSHPWIQVSTTGGTGSGALTVTIDTASLPTSGNFDGTIAVSSPNASTDPQLIPVRVRQMAAGTTAAPVGSFDTPLNNATGIAGAIAVTGWAVDDVNVDRVEIWRDGVNGEPAKVYIANGLFMSDARTDIEQLAPSTPMNYRAGWGYMLLTNGFPDIPGGRAIGGNGTFTLYALAFDAEGKQTLLGTKRITLSNGTSVKPFGTLDTPAQGETISGTSYISFGWALSPTSTIPTDGSTIDVYIDGVNLGHPTYNQYRADIADGFPGYSNSNGAVGFLVFNPSTLSNGVHTIGWFVVDAAGHAEGLGSRFFTVFNGTTSNSVAANNAGTSAPSADSGSQAGQKTEALADVPMDNAAVVVRRAFTPDNAVAVAMPEYTGRVSVNTRELEQVELHLANEFTDADGTYEGYLVVGEELRPLPGGSALDTANGVFTWQPGAGFVGSYDLLFVKTWGDGGKSKVPVRVTIAPKNEGKDSSDKKSKGGVVR